MKKIIVIIGAVCVAAFGINGLKKISKASKTKACC